MKCRYQEQNCALTLKEGIREYFDANPHLLLPDSFDPVTKSFFESHDKIHVVFGCSTAFSHEARADFWTMFGSDLGCAGYLKYLKSPVIRDLMKDLKEKSAQRKIELNMGAEALPALKAPVQVFSRSRSMKKKWPWLRNGAYLDRALSEIREEFGIRILL